jgi:hypothetical protein
LYPQELMSKFKRVSVLKYTNIKVSRQCVDAEVRGDPSNYELPQSMPLSRAINMMIKFVVVGGRVPARQPLHCVTCGSGFEDGYVHDCQHGLKYCDIFCFRVAEKLRELGAKRKGDEEVARNRRARRKRDVLSRDLAFFRAHYELD